MPRPKKKVAEKENPEAPKGDFGLQVGQVFADVKIVKINPNFERSIGFVRVKRAVDGAIVVKALTDSKGDVKKYVADWNDEVSWMTPPDFKSFVETRQRVSLVPPHLVG